MIDWKRVEELKEEIGADGFVEVADMFLDEADGAVRALISGLPDDEVEGQLHFLKGSALNLGLSELAAICQEGERKAAVGHAALIDLMQLASIWRASRQRLLSGLSEDQAGAALIRNSDRASSLVMSRKARPAPSIRRQKSSK